MVIAVEQRLIGGTLATDVLHRLREDIVSCVLKPGERLRFEALREIYGVSFSALRAAYIQSQKIEGWSLVSTLYDDGGFSGGSMERPALARLLTDVREGRVDVVVVYKVDRLTRSLNDFARIVDVFDAAGASFVSVTQQFNTTSSMGRLTLNVLLSFAQFEREVIAERVRDKIAQSKAKGMWMGGSVPIGYDVVDKKLVPNAEEAKTVQHIYRRYLALPSVKALMEELKAEGIVNKRRGTDRGGQPFVRGPLYHVLSNPIYIGKVPHRGQLHDGQHEPIIGQALWDAVQAKRQAGIGNKRERGNGQHGSLLTGMIWDHADRPMSPSHAVKQQRRYRYYVSSMAGADDVAMKVPALRLPARSWSKRCLIRSPAYWLAKAPLWRCRRLMLGRWSVAAARRRS